MLVIEPEDGADVSRDRGRAGAGSAETFIRLSAAPENRTALDGGGESDFEIGK